MLCWFYIDWPNQDVIKEVSDFTRLVHEITMEALEQIGLKKTYDGWVVDIITQVGEEAIVGVVAGEKDGQVVEDNMKSSRLCLPLRQMFYSRWVRSLGSKGNT